MPLNLLRSLGWSQEQRRCLAPRPHQISMLQPSYLKDQALAEHVQVADGLHESQVLWLRWDWSFCFCEIAAKRRDVVFMQSIQRVFKRFNLMTCAQEATTYVRKGKWMSTMNHYIHTYKFLGLRFGFGILSSDFMYNIWMKLSASPFYISNYYLSISNMNVSKRLVIWTLWISRVKYPSRRALKGFSSDVLRDSIDIQSVSVNTSVPDNWSLPVAWSSFFFLVVDVLGSGYDDGG